MDYTMFSRKRHLVLGHNDQPPLRMRKCFMDPSDSAAHQGRPTTSCCHPLLWDACVNRWRINHQNATKRLLELTRLWADTEGSVRRVLEQLKAEPGDIFLDHVANRKFLAFHKDITDEYGVEDKQHSWAVIEKQEEIIMYGPYYPNYSSGEHSEDIIIKQTQDLLEAEDFPDRWTVYVFTMNSPCLARDSDPCMLKLIQKANDWWSMYGIKTYIGYVRSWGFKGNKENLFKDINYRQVEVITQSVDYKSYIALVDKDDDLSPFCETVFSVAKDLLKAGEHSFPLITTKEKKDQKGYFKSMNDILESKQDEEEKTVLTKELNALVESAAPLLLLGENQSFEQHLEKGKFFLQSYTFNTEVCDTLREEMRVRFQECWRETVQDKCEEFIREKLTDGFNRLTVRLFVQDIHTLAQTYLQIGKLKL